MIVSGGRMKSFEVIQKQVLKKFYDNYITEISIMKSGWKDMYLVVYEFGDVEQVKIDLLHEHQLLSKFDELTIDELKMLS
jgi:hypothetical protein